MRRRSTLTIAPRGGLTLFEIVLSIAIFTMAMAALSQLISIGTKAKNSAQFQTEAAIRAENKMAEVVAGHLPLSAVVGEADPDNDRWLWTLEVAEAANATGLKELTVTVTHLSQTGDADASYAIKRLMRDPQLYIDAAQEAEDAAAAKSATQQSNSTTGSGTGTSSKTTGSSGTSSSQSSGSSTGSGSKSSPSTGGGSSSGGGTTSGKTSSKAKS